MRAIIAERPGRPEVLQPTHLPDPLPGPGQVRVAVQVAAVTFIDTQLRAGTGIGPTVEFPVVLGNGVAGRIDMVGQDVDPAWADELVVTATGGTGGYADKALARVADLHRIPTGLGVQEAAALLADGRTAVGLHAAARIQQGDVVAVTAAAGGVGGLLVQLASSGGAHVIALAGSSAKLIHARTLGADTGVNYRDQDWNTTLERVAPEGIDVVFDGVGGTATSTLRPLVRHGGRYLSHGAASGTWGATDGQQGVTDIGLDAIGSAPAALFDLVEHALALGAENALRATIGQTYPLDEAAKAHADIAARTTTGKTLLLP